MFLTCCVLLCPLEGKPDVWWDDPWTYATVVVVMEIAAYTILKDHLSRGIWRYSITRMMLYYGAE